jgi:histidine triad (HIT) family protein
MEITPEAQAQFDEQKKNCIFCKIISGEMDSKKVYEDDLVIGVLDINPALKGHVLFMPKEHYPIMPYIPPKTFKRLFGCLPQLSKALKKSMLTTGINIFVANGGVAGQQSPHFLFHLLPREKGDGLDKYSFSNKKDIDENKISEALKLLSNNIPLMMKNHFSRQPADWLNQPGNTAKFNMEEKTKGQVVYEDHKAIVVAAKNPSCFGHLQIFSNEEEKFIENLSLESCAHLFYVASYCATAVFEGLGAHGTNIILKSGLSGDNSDERLSIHVLPRYENDGLDLMWTPKQGENLDGVASSIKDKTFVIQESFKEKIKKEVINLDKREVEKISDGVKVSQDSIIDAVKKALKK